MPEGSETTPRAQGRDQTEADVFEARLRRMMDATQAHSQRALAAILGIRPSGVTDAKRRANVPVEWYLKLYSSHGLSPDWIMTGEGTRYIKDMGQGKQPSRQDRAPDSWTMAPIRSLLAPDGPELGRAPIPAEFNLPRLMVARMDGTRMEPAIQRGALLGIDLSDTSLRPGEIHVLKGPSGELHLHRVYCNGEEPKVILTCDNTSDKLTLSLENALARAKGRVAWVMQSI